MSSQVLVRGTGYPASTAAYGTPGFGNPPQTSPIQGAPVSGTITAISSSRPFNVQLFANPNFNTNPIITARSPAAAIPPLNNPVNNTAYSAPVNGGSGVAYEGQLYIFSDSGSDIVLTLE
jgi:hypothetical protein